MQHHTSQFAVPLGDGNTADVVICCFAAPPLRLVDSVPIPRDWLVHKLELSDQEFSTEMYQLRPIMYQLRPMMQKGDELWFFDEPAPPDVNAGVLGVALVRDGIPINSVVAGVH